MKMKSLLTVFMALTVALPTYSLAAHHTSGHGCMMSSWDMTELDADNSREITFEEYAEPHMDKLRNGFDMIDSDKDGVINETEWEELMNVHGVQKDQ